MDKRILLVGLLFAAVQVHARKEVPQPPTGSIAHIPAEDQAKDCGKFLNIRQSAIDSTMKWCKEQSKETCVVLDPGTLFPTIASEKVSKNHDEQPPGTGMAISSDAYYHTFSEGTEKFYDQCKNKGTFASQISAGNEKKMGLCKDFLKIRSEGLKKALDSCQAQNQKERCVLVNPNQIAPILVGETYGKAMSEGKTLGMPQGTNTKIFPALAGPQVSHFASCGIATENGDLKDAPPTPAGVGVYIAK